MGDYQLKNTKMFLDLGVTIEFGGKKGKSVSIDLISSLGASQPGLQFLTSSVSFFLYAFRPI